MFTLNCRGRLLTVDKPLVMGIINTTPDSFYSGSRHQGLDDILKQAEKMLTEGATILDIGGQSTRPGSDKVGIEEELKRVIEPITAIKKHFPETFISIDTYNARVVSESVAAGAAIVNDISAGNLDDEMLSTVAQLRTPYILMHMQGEPATMQVKPVYSNVTSEVLDFLIEKKTVLHKNGIYDIIVDPGLGFGKSIDHNFELMRHFEVFNTIGCPVLLGISRKSTVYRTLGVTPGEALNGTTVMHTIGLLKGAMILRVHDVKEAMEAVKLVTACIK